MTKHVFRRSSLAPILFLLLPQIYATDEDLVIRNDALDKKRNMRGRKKKQKKEKSRKRIPLVSDELFGEDGGVLYGGRKEEAEITFDMQESSLPDLKSYIVKFKDDGHEINTQQTAFDMGVALGSEPDHIYSNLVKGFSITIPYLEKEKIMSNFVWSTTVDYIFEDQEMEAFQEETPNGVRRVQADLVTDFQPSDDVVAAVLDSGVDLDHPDLNLQECVSFISSEPSCNDGNGHGTHVAGTIGGRYTGVAPGTAIWGVKVLNRNGNGSISGIVAGIDFVVGRARETGKQVVLNMSLGGRGRVSQCDEECSCENDVFHEAVCNAINAGIPVVVAAGNSNADSTNFRPANFADAITVSAFADTDGEPGGKGPSHRFGADETLATFSNFGRVVDISAPGVAIRSTWNNGAYATISGTSMAAPHVAGAAVIYMTRNDVSKDRIGSEKVRQALLDATDLQSGDRGFTDDKDEFPEDVLNVFTMTNGDDEMPSETSVEVILDKFEYMEGDLDATVTVLVADENDRSVAGLPIEAFDASIYESDSLIANPDVIFEETFVAGQYTSLIDISGLSVGVPHTIEVNVTNISTETTGVGQAKFVIEASNKPAVFVGSITYELRVSDFDRQLFIEIVVSPPLTAALVGLQLFWNNLFVGEATAETNEDGSVKYFLRNPPSGTFSVIVTKIEIADHTYDPSQNADDPTFEIS